MTPSTPNPQPPTPNPYPAVGFLLVLLIVWLGTTDLLLACPTCKDGLAHDDASLSGVAQGFSYSIMLMMSMPFLILGGLGTYFYWEIRRARKRLAAGETIPGYAS